LLKPVVLRLDKFDVSWVQAVFICPSLLPGSGPVKSGAEIKTVCDYFETILFFEHLLIHEISSVTSIPREAITRILQYKLEN